MNPFYTNLTLYSLAIAVAIFLGGILPILRKWNRKHLPLVISFSAGLLLGSAFFHLFPEANELVGAKQVGLYVLLGFSFLFLIERLITVHVCEALDCEVHQIGISAFIGIGLHTLTNGIALGSSLMVPGLSLAVFIAIAAHKAPEAFSLSSILLHTEFKKLSIVLLNLFVLAMVPLGAILAYSVLKPEGTEWIGKVIAFSAGTFLHISLSDLLPEAHRHSLSKLKTTLLFILGLGLMYLLENQISVH